MTLDGHSDSRKMAIIRRPQFGVGDRGTVALWFTVYVTDSTAALQVFDVDGAVQIITAYGVDDVAKLDGKPCWVEDNGATIRYVEACRA